MCDHHCWDEAESFGHRGCKDVANCRYSPIKSMISFHNIEVLVDDDDQYLPSRRHNATEFSLVEIKLSLQVEIDQ